MKTIEKLMLCAVLMLSAAVSVRAQQVVDEEPLAIPSQQQLIKPLQLGLNAIEVQPVAGAERIELVEVNVVALRDLAVHHEHEIQIYDRLYQIIIDRREVSALNTVLRGHFKNEPQSTFVVAIVGDTVAGMFQATGMPRMVRLRYGGPGVHYLHEVTLDANDECAGSPNAPVAAQAARRDNEQTIDSLRQEILDLLPPEARGETEGACLNLPDSYFDILIVSSSQAVLAAGGVNAIRAEGTLAVEAMTTALSNSNLAARARVAWFQEVSYTELDGYQEHLERLTDPSDGVMDSVHGTRATVEADFVVLLVDDSASGGLGWCDASHDSAFSVARWTVAASNFTLAHEVGHNLGCAHNPEDADCEPYDDAYGHHFFVSAENLRRHTVMSYSVNGSTRIAHYSSPSINYMGVATGTSTRNNRNRINLRRTTCAGFRTTRMDVWLDFAGGFGTGTFSNPYNSLAVAMGRVQNDGQYLPTLPVLHIKEGGSTSPITITKAMEIRSCGGTVTIGQ